MNKKRLFFNFLQKHNALKAYKRNFNIHRIGYDECIELNRAFIWLHTPEGQRYWSELHYKWNTYYQDYKRNHF